MIEKLFAEIGHLGHGSYIIIFLASFLESSAFMGLIVPGETIVLLAGMLASQGYINLWNSILIISIGAILGDSTGYALGKRIGCNYFCTHKRLLFLTKQHLQKTDKYFKRHGGKTIFFGRFIGILRAMAPFAAGISDMPYRRFLAYNIAGGIIWAVSFTLMGYFLGESWGIVEKWSGRVGVFVVFIVLIAACLVYLYKYLSGKEEEVHKLLEKKQEAVASNQLIKRLMTRYPGFVDFISKRLSAGSYLGLHLTIGFVLSVLFIWILGGITEDILTGDPFVIVDLWVLHQVLYFRTPLVSKIMVAFTDMSGTIVMSAGGLLVTACFIVKRRLDYVVGYLIAISGGLVLAYTLKLTIQRMRPPSTDALIIKAGWSFPSGHATLAVLFYGMINYFIIRNIASWRVTLVSLLASGFIIFFTGMSSIYLHSNYLSDVVAGYVVGLLWLTVCITGLEIFRGKKDGPSI